MTTRTALATAVLAVSTCTTPLTAGDAPKTRNVAIVVHEGVELLDFAGPGEVFAAAANRGARPGQPWFNVYTVAPTTGRIVSQGFLTIEPEYSIADCPAPDILVIPGGRTGVLTRDESFMSWVKTIAPETEISMSVCTGALVLGMNGLLDGKDATTHWGAIARLRSVTPKARIHEDRRVIDNGSIITTAGVSAGIDGALHVVARLLGREAAVQTARGMEYRWEPEAKLAEHYSEMNPQLDARGQALQKAWGLRDAGRWSEAVKAYEAILEQHPDDGEAWYGLGYALHAMGDLEAAIPAHQRAAETFDPAARPLYNLACAYALLKKPDQAFTALAAAVEAGFDNRAWIDADSDFDGLRADPRYAEIVGAISAPKD